MTPYGRDKLKQQLIRDEGLRLYPYVDTAGKITIGIGHNLTDIGLEPDIVEAIFERDLARTRDEVFVNLPWVALVDEVRQAALLNLAFNVGLGSLRTFRDMLAAAEAGDWATAAMELLDSRYAGQVGDRARRVARQLETGEWT